jgi:hypothetical protein
MPTADDQDTAKDAGREANAALFSILRDRHREMADHHRQGAEREAAAVDAVDRMEAAHAGRAMTAAERRRLLRSLGMTPICGTAAIWPPCANWRVARTASCGCWRSTASRPASGQGGGRCGPLLAAARR